MGERSHQRGTRTLPLKSQKGPSGPFPAILEEEFSVLVHGRSNRPHASRRFRREYSQERCNRGCNGEGFTASFNHPPPPPTPRTRTSIIGPLTRWYRECNDSVPHNQRTFHRKTGKNRKMDSHSAPPSSSPAERSLLFSFFYFSEGVVTIPSSFILSRFPLSAFALCASYAVLSRTTTTTTTTTTISNQENMLARIVVVDLAVRTSIDRVPYPPSPLSLGNSSCRERVG